MTLEGDDFKNYYDIQLDKWKFRKRIMYFIGYKDDLKQNDLTDDEYMQSIAHFKHRKGTGKSGKHSRHTTESKRSNKR